VETFVVRVHVTGGDAHDAAGTLRGVVRHVSSGEEVTFREPQRLLEFVAAHVERTKATRAP
jgi:hypothetical protein